MIYWDIEDECVSIYGCSENTIVFSRTTNCRGYKFKLYYHSHKRGVSLSEVNVAFKIQEIKSCPYPWCLTYHGLAISITMKCAPSCSFA